MHQESILLAILYWLRWRGFYLTACAFAARNALLSGGVATALCRSLLRVRRLVHVARLVALPEAERVIRVSYFNWLAIGGLELPVAFVIDPLSILMVLIIWASARSSICSAWVTCPTTPRRRNTSRI